LDAAPEEAIKRATNWIFDIQGIIEEVQKEDSDYRYNLMVYPDTDGSVYLMVFGGHSVILNLLENFPELEDYHYQDQTDKTDDISDEEWEKRENTWDRLIGDDYIPVRHGLSLQSPALDVLHFEYYKTIRDTEIQIEDKKRISIISELTGKKRDTVEEDFNTYYQNPTMRI
jgi:hypothetical protein